ncbi:MAG TPA: hypothetical protein PKO06_16585, partial [Candidatus Ozemobacteraceae bacterium]|nr:hypothetical protein [Candidatus Ozemobacteraceae bacterium]
PSKRPASVSFPASIRDLPKNWLRPISMGIWSRFLRPALRSRTIRLELDGAALPTGMAGVINIAACHDGTKPL